MRPRRACPSFAQREPEYRRASGAFRCVTARKCRSNPPSLLPHVDTEAIHLLIRAYQPHLTALRRIYLKHRPPLAASPTKMTELFTAEAAIALVTLTVLEIVLGIDNIIFIRSWRANSRRNSSRALAYLGWGSRWEHAYCCCYL